jgi:hypothetical protein
VSITQGMPSPDCPFEPTETTGSPIVAGMGQDPMISLLGVEKRY